MMNFIKSKEICNSYLTARKMFLEYANNLHELNGNDNIIGRIGEFIVFQILLEEGREPELNKSRIEKGYDLICDYDTLKGIKDTKVSVKVITSENKAGRTTKIKEPWHELFIIILNGDNKIEKIGRLKRSQFDYSQLFSKSEPVASKSMFKSGGIMEKFGEILNANQCSKYL